MFASETIVRVFFQGQTAFGPFRNEASVSGKCFKVGWFSILIRLAIFNKVRLAESVSDFDEGLINRIFVFPSFDVLWTV